MNNITFATVKRLSNEQWSAYCRSIRDGMVGKRAGRVNELATFKQPGDGAPSIRLGYEQRGTGAEGLERLGPSTTVSDEQEDGWRAGEAGLASPIVAVLCAGLMLPSPPRPSQPHLGRAWRQRQGDLQQPACLRNAHPHGLALDCWSGLIFPPPPGGGPPGSCGRAARG